MNLILKGIKQLTHPRIFVYKLYGVLLDTFAPLIGDKLFLKLKWRRIMDYPLDFNHPKTFNEKLQWLKIHDRRPEYSTMVDKYAVKDYVAKIIGKEHVIPTIGVWNRVEEINFDTLPNQFVLKCTHDSGGVAICKAKDNFDREVAIKKLAMGLKQSFYYQTREWPYKNVQPRVIAECYMEDESGYELKDYKFFCFNARCEFFKIDFDRQRNHHANYYNRNCELLYFGEESCPPDYSRELIIPSNMNEMINLAEQIASNVHNSFVRIDLYNINGYIYFGEITFYPASGVGKFTPNEWDAKIGNLLNLSIDDFE